MIYLFMKFWAIGLIGFSIFLLIAAHPSIITKYGHTNNVIDAIIRSISILLLLAWIFPHKDLAIDTFGYINKGSDYIEEKECRIKETYNSVWFFFSQKGILCENGDRYIDIFSKRFYSTDEIMVIKSLPRSTLIIDVKTP